MCGDQIIVLKHLPVLGRGCVIRLKIAKISLKIAHFHVSNLFTSVACGKLRAEYNIDLQPTANKSYWLNFFIFSCRCGVFSVHAFHIFLCETAFVFDKIKTFSKDNNFVFSGQMSLRIIAWVVAKPTYASKTFQWTSGDNGSIFSHCMGRNTNGILPEGCLSIVSGKWTRESLFTSWY